LSKVALILGLNQHGDQGVCYSTGSYLALLDQYGMIRSISGKKNRYSSAVAKSFISALKNELAHHRNFNMREQARPEIIENIDLP